MIKNKIAKEPHPLKKLFGLHFFLWNSMVEDKVSFLAVSGSYISSHSTVFKQFKTNI